MERWGTSLKPAYEPIVMARKPFPGALIDNILKVGVGGLNIEGCKIGDEEMKAVSHVDLQWVDREMKRIEGRSGMSFGQISNAPRLMGKAHIGRFPANVMTDGSAEVAMGMPDTKGSSGGPNYDLCANQGNPVKFKGTNYKSGMHFDDSGSAMRYFYQAKATKKDRDEGLDLFEDQTKVFNGKSDRSSENMGEIEERFTTTGKNIHPTVKPVELMQYLVRLVSPKGSVVMDCFMGSGSTGKAVMFENRERDAGYKFIGVEMTDQYLPICKARILYAKDKYEYEFRKEMDRVRKDGQMVLDDLMEL